MPNIDQQQQQQLDHQHHCNQARKSSGSHQISFRRNSNTIKPVKEEILYLSKSLQLTEYTFKDEKGKPKSAEVIHKRYLIGVNNKNNNNNNDDEVEIEENTILSIAILKRHCLCDCLIMIRQYRPTLKSYTLEFPARVVEQQIVDKSGIEAAKEIEENTGYGSTKIEYVSPQTSTDPELCDSKVKLVSMMIDGDDPIKNNYIQTKKLMRSSEESIIKVKHGKKHHHHHNNSNNNNNNNNDDNDNNNNNKNTNDNNGNNNNNNNNENNDNISNNSNNNNADDDDDDEDEEIEIILLPINGLLDRLKQYCDNGTIVDSRVFAFAIGLKKGEKMNQTKNDTKPESIEL